MFGLGTKKEQTMEDTKFAKGKSYLYVKGEKFNNTVQIESVKQPYVYFTDGTRITIEIFDEYLVESESMDKDFSFDNIKAGAQLKNQNLVQNLDNKNVINLSPSVPVQQKKDSVKSDISPVTLILEKQKPEEVEFTVQLKVKVPDKNLIPVLSSSFGEDTTIKDLYEYVFSKINYDDFRDDIKAAVQKHYGLKEISTKKKIKKD